ncbi:DUF3592 domain-containing protein [Arthrobacter oryzae]|uniref:DUF3592 domain-containing protein n=1 Tax=Arthrobacter oryzae TaxID=409290 RepID=UPI00273CA08E|nr:DUF3592 domain-containing protein [Arthrobacter oryzae]WLQ08137.1 DUF3592 domain-containing protein [Arthrobacter oryzae]
MESIEALFVGVPAMFLVVGVLITGFSLAGSFRRRYAQRGWVPVQATVTGNLHGKDGPASNGQHRFAPSYEFPDSHGRRWLGQSDIYGADQEIIGTRIPVLYNPANPAESTRPVFVVSKGSLSVGLILAAFGAGGTAMFTAVFL